MVTANQPIYRHHFQSRMAYWLCLNNTYSIYMWINLSNFPRDRTDKCFSSGVWLTLKANSQSHLFSSFIFWHPNAHYFIKLNHHSESASERAPGEEVEGGGHKEGWKPDGKGIDQGEIWDSGCWDYIWCWRYNNKRQIGRRGGGDVTGGSVECGYSNEYIFILFHSKQHTL